MRLYIRVRACAESRAQPSDFPNHSPYLFICLRQGLSLKSELSDSARFSGLHIQGSSRIYDTGIPGTHNHASFFYMEAKYPSTSSCAASILSSDLSPHSRNYTFFTYKSYFKRSLENDRYIFLICLNTDINNWNTKLTKQISNYIFK